MPAIKLQTYAQMIGNLSYSGVEYAKESRFVPEIAKTKLDTSVALVMKYNGSHVNPLLSVADEHLEKAYTKTNDVYGDIAAKYAEGGMKKVAVDTYPVVMDNVVTPVAENLTARTAESRQRVQALWSSSQRTKDRMLAKAFDSADAVKSYTSERAQQIVHTDLISYAKAMESSYVEPALETGRYVVDQSVRYVRESDLAKLREDLSFLAAEAQRLSHEKLSIAVEKVDATLKAGRATVMEGFNNGKSVGADTTTSVVTVVTDFPLLQARGLELLEVVKGFSVEKYTQVMQRLDSLFHTGMAVEVPVPVSEVVEAAAQPMEVVEPTVQVVTEVKEAEVFEDARDQ